MSRTFENKTTAEAKIEYKTMKLWKRYVEPPKGIFEGEVSQVHQYITNWPLNTFSKRVWGQPVIPTDQ